MENCEGPVCHECAVEDEASVYTLCSKFPSPEPTWCATRWGPQERVTHSLCLKTTVGSLAGVGGFGHPFLPEFSALLV